MGIYCPSLWIFSIKISTTLGMWTDMVFCFSFFLFCKVGSFPKWIFSIKTTEHNCKYGSSLFSCAHSNLKSFVPKIEHLFYAAF